MAGLGFTLALTKKKNISQDILSAYLILVHNKLSKGFTVYFTMASSVYKKKG